MSVDRLRFGSPTLCRQSQYPMKMLGMHLQANGTAITQRGGSVYCTNTIPTSTLGNRVEKHIQIDRARTCSTGCRACIGHRASRSIWALKCQGSTVIKLAYLGEPGTLMRLMETTLQMRRQRRIHSGIRPGERDFGLRHISLRLQRVLVPIS